MEEAIRALAPAVTVQLTPWLRQSPGPASVNLILESVYGDNPDLFYVEIWCGQCRRVGLNKLEVQLVYRIPAEKCPAAAAELEAAVQRILKRQFPSGWKGMSHIRREKLIFDDLVEHVTYWHAAIIRENGMIREKFPLAWTAYGALVKGQAVCHGIAAAFKLLCDRVGIPCILVLGTAKERHAWNIVSIGHRFFHVDCTWNLRTSINRRIPYMRYRYFNLPDRIMLAERSVECGFLPECKSLRYNPFFMRGLCVQNADDLLPMAAARLAAREKRFAFLLDCDQQRILSSVEIRQALRNLTGKRVTIYRDSFFIGFVVI